MSSFWSSSSNFLASSAQKAQKENGDRTFLALLSKQTESSPNYCDNSVRWRGGSQDRMSEAKGKANGTCVSTKQTGPLRKSSTTPACAGAPERKEEQETEQLDGAGHHSGDEKGWFCVCETFPVRGNVTGKGQVPGQCQAAKHEVGPVCHSVLQVGTG